jgi:hypothetical protein
MISKVSIPVVDAHAHFFTADTLKSWSQRGRTMEGFQERTKARTDMKEIKIPDKSWDVPRRWVEEMDRYGVQAVGFMVGREAYDEFLEARRRYPGRFMGYANIDPRQADSIERVSKAASDDLQGIKLYPSSWGDIHAYDEVCYPIYEEAERNDLVVFLHFGITIGSQADLRSGNPIDIQRPSRDFPELNFVIAHFGAGWFREVLLMQYQADNVYMDSSGSNSWMRYLPYDIDLHKIFEKAITAGGPKKVLFGTDSTFFPRGWRNNILEDQYRAIERLTEGTNALLDEEDVKDIFRGNILRLTGFNPES